MKHIASMASLLRIELAGPGRLRENPVLAEKLGHTRLDRELCIYVECRTL